MADLIDVGICSWGHTIWGTNDLVFRVAGPRCARCMTMAADEALALLDGPVSPPPYLYEERATVDEIIEHAHRIGGAAA